MNRLLKLKQNTIFNFLLLINIVLYVLGAAYLNYFSLIAFILSTYIILKFDVQQSMELCALLAPIAGIMKFITSISLFNFIYLFIFIKILVYKNFKLKKNFLLFVLLLLFESLYSILIQDFSIIGEIFSLLISMFFLGMVISSDIKFNLHAIIEKFSISLVISAFLDIFSSFFPGLSKYLASATFKLESGEKLDRLSGFIGNPNHYSVALNIAIMCFFVYVFYKNRKTDLFYLIGLSGIGVYTLSKSFMLTFLLSIALLLLYLMNKNPIIWIKFLLGGVIFIFVLTRFVDIKYISIMIDRVSLSGIDNLNSYTTGRITRYLTYVVYILSDVRVFLFGDGLYNTLEFASHNFFLEMVYYVGILGSLTFTFIFAKLRDKKFRVQTVSWLFYSPLLILLFRGMAVNLVTSIVFPMYVIIVYLFIEDGERILNNTYE